jgi:hypothetical protein
VLVIRISAGPVAAELPTTVSEATPNEATATAAPIRRTFPLLL